MTEPDVIRWRRNLQGEVDGALVYHAMADATADQRLAELYRRMAAMEEGHGQLWRERLEAAAATRTVRPSWRAASVPGWWRR